MRNMWEQTKVISTLHYSRNLRQILQGPEEYISQNRDAELNWATGLIYNDFICIEKYNSFSKA